MEIKVLLLAGEGGSLTFHAAKTSSGWVFYRLRNEAGMADLLDSEDQDLISLLSSKGKVYENLTDLLNRNRTYILNMVPRYCHSLFSAEVYQFIRNLTKEHSLDVEEWEWILFRDNKILEAAKLVHASKRLTVLTGAGASQDSGVPVFRSTSENALWNKMNPQEVATVEALEENYDVFHRFYSERIKHLETVMPHAGHYILAEWEEQGKLTCIVTSNVDRLNQKASCTNVEELHGNIVTFRCHSCGMGASKESFMNKEMCSYCGGKLRPNVVLFGESLPQKAWKNALSYFEQADVVLVIGTSLSVFPANQLPFMTKAKIVLINLEETGLEDKFDVFIQCGAEDALRAIQSWLEFL